MFVLCLFFIRPDEIPGRAVSGLVVMSAEKTTSKKQLRRKMSARRRDLERHWAAAASARICRHIVCHSLFKFARRAGVYLAKDNEADLSALLRPGAAFNKEFYCPKLLPPLWLRSEMCFLPINAKTPLLPNRYGIAEPVTASARQTAADHLNILFLPLLAFDRHGGRLGMGGGFYDRHLGRCRRLPTLIGVGYACQGVLRVPTEPRDIRLDFVVTECGWADCRVRG